MPAVKPNTTNKIDWQVPWLTHLPKLLHGMCLKDLPHQLNRTFVELNQTNAKTSIGTKASQLTTGLGKPLSFIPQDALPENTAYESHIASTGGVPTRDNLHDFFNAAVWLTFPKTKKTINALQDVEIKREGVNDRRTSVRDALTLFDENGAVLVVAKPKIGQALKNFDWQNALVNPRSDWENPLAIHTQESKLIKNNSKACVYLFGHALMEQLIAPRKPMCAHTLILSVEPAWFELPLAERLEDIDTRLAYELQSLVSSNELKTRSYSPLPILGVPHFWDENADPAFYDDAFVFRSGRRNQAKVSL